MSDNASNNESKNYTTPNERRSLDRARETKKDEFYTQLIDISNELKHYRDKFKGKVVFCNCDDPYESNFFKYFALNFEILGLKKLICTCYDDSPFLGDELDLFPDEKENKKAYKVEITSVKDLNGDGAFDLTDVDLLVRQKDVVTKLKGNGDFRSDECVELLKESDVVVTNPPFSLFREYVAQLIEYEKDFLIIGNQNAITYKEIFPLIKDNKMWLGNGFNKGNAYFKVPDSMNVDYANGVYDPETKLVKFRNCRWFTNIDFKKRHEPLVLYETYSAGKYPKYDNYDAINVDKTAKIPVDYDGVMGVPITFMDRYCPEQFDIIGMSSSAGYNPSIVGIPLLLAGDARPLINQKATFARIFIKKNKDYKEI